MIVTSHTKESAETPTLGKSLLGEKSEKSDTFANLLHGFNLDTKDEKAPAKGMVLLNLVDEEKGIDLSALNLKDEKEEGSSKDLLALLRSDDVEVKEGKKDFVTDLKFFNPKVIKNLDDAEVKTLIKEAKTYLKEQINLLEPTKETPKTLSALVKMSAELGIKLENISFKELVPKGESKLSTKEDVKSLLTRTNESSENKVVTKEITDKVMHFQKEGEKQVPLFSKEISTLVSRTSSEHTTAQIVQIKGKENFAETKKESKESGLQALLNGSKNSSEPTPVNNTRIEVFKEVLQKMTEPQKQSETVSENSVKTTNSSALNELLGNSDKASTTTLNVKTEALDVKVVEAKQLMRHFGGELKQAVEDYKPPFTKLEMKLNPAKFGDVDLTMVQRGNNVHIMLNSNTQAITAMMQNVQELKNQLAQNGMGNATLNFSSGDGQANQGQDHQQNSQEQRRKELLEQYEYAENSSEYEIATELEIILPRYI